MAHMQLRCYTGSGFPVSQPCFFRQRPCAEFRLQHYAKHACRTPVRPAHIRLRADNGLEARASASHGGQCSTTASEPLTVQQQPSLIQRLLTTLRNIGVAALMLLLGLTHASTAHARVPPPQPDPGFATASPHSGLECARSGLSGGVPETGPSQPFERCWSHDTGIQLAEERESKEDLLRRMNAPGSKQELVEGSQPSKDSKLGYVPLEERKGPKVDLTRSKVVNPDDVPDKDETEFPLPGTSWKIERFRNMTYTQFWQLISEGRIAKVYFYQDHYTAKVWTKASAPGGARCETIGLPFDPDLFPFLKNHDVKIEEEPVNIYKSVYWAFSKLIFPLWLGLFILTKLSEDEDVAELRRRKTDRFDQVIREETRFSDIAGIDQVKNEILELVEFLKNPKKFTDLGAKAPAGILFCGPPGTGKTLMARAIAGEAGVPFYNIAGTAFSGMFVGLGAAKVREIFARARENSPCIMFIDEFDGIGQHRTEGGGGNDESVTTINQMLTEMDGFDDNTNVVVMAATNRPETLDSALTRPGRFDRIIQMPLPNVQGRKDILAVHSKGRKVEKDVDMEKIARATAGTTGAELANVMNLAAIVAVRQGRDVINETDMFDALELQSQEKFRAGATATEYDEQDVPAAIRRNIAVYEASRCLIGVMTPHFDEISKVSVCVNKAASGYTYFIPQEDALESEVFTRGYLEARLVVGLAGRCGERLVLGQGSVTTSSAADIERVNFIAREMVYKLGFNQRLGPVSLLNNEETYINTKDAADMADIGTELAAVALKEVTELVEAAEAKALYGLTLNYKALEALTNRLIHVSVMSGAEVRQLLKEHGMVPFPDTYLAGFKWAENGHLIYPGMADKEMQMRSPDADNQHGAMEGVHPMNPYRVRTDLPAVLEPIF